MSFISGEGELEGPRNFGYSGSSQQCSRYEFIAFHFTAMTKTNKFNGEDFLQVCTSLWEC